MNRNLRKRHLRYWIVLAILLPVGFVWALVAIPQFVSEKPIRKNIPLGLEHVVKEQTHDTANICIRSDKKGNFQLEIILKEPLESPSPGLYLKVNGTTGLKGNVFLGNIGSRGTYRFSISEKQMRQAKGAIIHCNVNGHSLENISFNL